MIEQRQALVSAAKDYIKQMGCTGFRIKDDGLCISVRRQQRRKSGIRPGPKLKVDSEKAREAASLLQGGKLFNETAKALGVNPRTLSSALEREGLRLPYQKLSKGNV